MWMSSHATATQAVNKQSSRKHAAMLPCVDAQSLSPRGAAPSKSRRAETSTRRYHTHETQRARQRSLQISGGVGGRERGEREVTTTPARLARVHRLRCPARFAFGRRRDSYRQAGRARAPRATREVEGRPAPRRAVAVRLKIARGWSGPWATGRRRRACRLPDRSHPTTLGARARRCPRDREQRKIQQKKSGDRVIDPFYSRTVCVRRCAWESLLRSRGLQLRGRRRQAGRQIAKPAGVFARNRRAIRRGPGRAASCATRQAHRFPARHLKETAAKRKSRC